MRSLSTRVDDKQRLRQGRLWLFLFIIIVFWFGLFLFFNSWFLGEGEGERGDSAIAIIIRSYKTTMKTTRISNAALCAMQLQKRTAYPNTYNPYKNFFYFDDRIFFVVPLGQVSCGCGWRFRRGRLRYWIILLFVRHPAACGGWTLE